MSRRQAYSFELLTLTPCLGRAVVIWLQAVGDAPILKQQKVKVSGLAIFLWLLLGSLRKLAVARCLFVSAALTCLPGLFQIPLSSGCAGLGV